jgi:hypothetical protein
MFCSPQPSITNLVVCLKDMLGVEEASTLPSVGLSMP